MKGGIYSWPLTALGRDRFTEVHYIVKNVGRARNWPLSAGDRFTEVTVNAGLTVTRSSFTCL